MGSANDPLNPTSDVRLLEEAIRETAEVFGLREFALGLVEAPMEQRKAA